MGKGELSAEELLRLANSASSKDPNALLGAVEKGSRRRRKTSFSEFSEIKSSRRAAQERAGAEADEAI